MAQVYITKATSFLPNDSVSNDEIENHLGIVEGSSKIRSIVLKNNGIKKRYYAIDNKGESTHTNVDITYEAIKKILNSDFTLNDIELLSCGTSTPDQLLPSHASMVHGKLNNQPIEINSSSGICCSGMSALKYGFLSLKADVFNNAICTGSEKVSTWLTSKKFENEYKTINKLKEKPITAFNKEFLRWMLSDGAGAFLLENKPSKKSPSLKIEWIDFFSFAHEVETCMYAGGEKMENGNIKPWSDYEYDDWGNESIFSIKQDIKLLGENIIEKGYLSLMKTIKKRNLDVEQIDYFLPHISSFYFKDKLYEKLKSNGLNISLDKWFLNLEKMGNVGSASIYLMVEELLNSNQLKKGEKLLLSVPESGRFNYAYALLTVV